jgi:hypothetical protein
MERVRRVLFWLLLAATGLSILLGTASLEWIGVAVGLLAVIQAPDLWDRYKPQPKAARPAAADERQYLEGRLRAFEQEEERFIALAGEAIETRFEAYSAAFTPNQPGQPLKEYMDIASAVRDYTQFVIVGDPGAGKSTSLRYLASQTAKQRLAGKRVPLPLWIDLGNSANPPDAEDLLDYWWSEYGLPGDAKRALTNADVWLFLDGLNEMPEQQASRKERAASLKKLIEQYPNVRVIVTCRVRDYEGDMKLGELPVVRVLPLDEGRTEQFVKQRLLKLADELLSKLNSSDALKRMAANPYNLVMLIEVYRARRTLPANLNDLYRLYVLETYNVYAKRGLLRLKWPTLERKLQRLAFRMIVRGKGTAADAGWVQRQIGLRALEDGVNLGVLVQDGSEETVRFYHQTLHGYFALPGLTRTLQHKWWDSALYTAYHFFEKRLRGQRRLWYETKFPMLENRVAFLVSNIGALGEGGTPAIAILCQKLNDPDRDVRRSAVNALGSVGTSLSIDPLITALQSPDGNLRWRAASSLAYIDAQEAIPALCRLLDDSDIKVQGIAAATLVTMGIIDIFVVKALYKAFSHEAFHVRFNTYYLLRQLFVQAAIPLLIEFLQDTNVNVRECAVRVLQHHDAKEAVAALTNILHDDPSAKVRLAASDALEEIGTPEALAALEAWRRERTSGTSSTFP